MTLSAATIRKTGWSLAADLLLLPALAMVFTDEMNWGPSDFLAAALLLGTTGVVLEIVAVLPRRQWRTWACLVALPCCCWCGPSSPLASSTDQKGSTLPFLENFR